MFMDKRDCYFSTACDLQEISNLSIAFLKKPLTAGCCYGSTGSKPVEWRPVLTIEQSIAVAVTCKLWESNLLLQACDLLKV